MMTMVSLSEAGSEHCHAAINFSDYWIVEQKVIMICYGQNCLIRFQIPGKVPGSKSFLFPASRLIFTQLFFINSNNVQATIDYSSDINQRA